MSALRVLFSVLAERLKDDVALAAAIGGRVYDGRGPKDTPYPFVTLGDETETTTGSTFGRRGLRDTVSVHVWSLQKTAEGFPVESGEEARTIGQLVEDAAGSAPLDLGGAGSYALKPDFTFSLRDPETGARHLILRLRMFALEVAT